MEAALARLSLEVRVACTAQCLFSGQGNSVLVFCVLNINSAESDPLGSIRFDTLTHIPTKQMAVIAQWSAGYNTLLHGGSIWSEKLKCWQHASNTFQFFYSSVVSRSLFCHQDNKVSLSGLQVTDRKGPRPELACLCIWQIELVCVHRCAALLHTVVCVYVWSVLYKCVSPIEDNSLGHLTERLQTTSITWRRLKATSLLPGLLLKRRRQLGQGRGITCVHKTHTCVHTYRKTHIHAQ